VIFIARWAIGCECDATHSTDYAVARCLSVRLSVTRRYCAETPKYIIRHFSPSIAKPFLIFIARQHRNADVQH